MSDIYSPYEYVNNEPRDLLKSGGNSAVLFAIKMIPSFLKERRYRGIIEIAALLPPLDEMEKILDDREKEFGKKGMERSSENLHDALDSIRIALSQVVREMPYRLSKDNINELSVVIDKYSVEGKEHWAKELFKIFSDEEELGGQLLLWTVYFSKIKELIKAFGFSKEEIREILKKVFEKEEEYEKDAEFWVIRLPKIACIVREFDLSKEAGEMFEGIIEKNKKNDPDACIEIAIKMNIPIDHQEFQKIADGFLKKANGADSCFCRVSYVSTACQTYKRLKEKYQLSDDRERLLKIYDNDDYAGAQEKVMNRVIFMASRIIKGEEGFEYKKQGFWDIHM